VSYRETDGVKAAILVGEADERAGRQRETLDENRRKGFSTLLSEQVLASMLDTLDLLRKDLAKIEANLERKGAVASGSPHISEEKVPSAAANGTEEVAGKQG
jgi:hypothetical protein